jgi:hypothetical protein
MHKTYAVKAVRAGNTGATPAVEREIDLSLAVLCAMAQGVRLTIWDIARVSGLSHGGVEFLEKNALKKLRRRLQRAMREETS